MSIPPHLAAFGSRDFRYIWGANALGGASTWTFLIASQWYVLSESDKSVFVGLFTFASMLPYLYSSVYIPTLYISHLVYSSALRASQLVSRLVRSRPRTPLAGSCWELGPFSFRRRRRFPPILLSPPFGDERSLYMPSLREARCNVRCR